MEMLRFGLVARETKTSREREVIEMMDYIPDTSVRPSNGNIVTPEKVSLVEKVKTNSDLISECCEIARRINTFIFASVDENTNVNKLNPNCLTDEIECQRIDLRTLQTILMQIMNELGA